MSTEFLQIPEGKIAYSDQGTGPLVVCVPGMGDLRGEYRFLTLQLLSEGFRVVAMDTRGHGETSVGWKDYSVAGVGSDTLALIRSLGAGPAVVVGTSMAAGAAVWAAAEAPDLVRALVLIDPAVHGDPDWLTRGLLAGFFARPWGTAAWMWYYAKLFPGRKPADWVEYTAALKSNLAQPGRLESLRSMMVASKAASASRLEKVTVPTLILMGSKDPDFKDPESEAQWVAGQVKGAYHIIAGAGHYPHVEMPEIAGPKIVAFLKTLQPEVNLESARD
ncbi:MAG: alpha/beta hydrolase [Chloroflexi bacterium]|nr:alpha/beta hydrolase [Chloroflexota bacterium]